MFGLRKRELVDRRREPRKPMFMPVRIVFNNGLSTVDCIAENLSEHGALLVLPSPLLISRHIVVSISGKHHRARVAWKEGRRIGINWT